MRIYVEGTGTPYDNTMLNIGDRRGPRFNIEHYAGPPTTLYLYPTGKVRWDGDIPVEIWAPKDADVQL